MVERKIDSVIWRFGRKVSRNNAQNLTSVQSGSMRIVFSHFHISYIYVNQNMFIFVAMDSCYTCQYYEITHFIILLRHIPDLLAWKLLCAFFRFHNIIATKCISTTTASVGSGF